jgi:DNA polymerase I-like protein with 3'-5' exonuclease and polymerase domains
MAKPLTVYHGNSYFHVWPFGSANLLLDKDENGIYFLLMNFYLKFFRKAMHYAGAYNVGRIPTAHPELIITEVEDVPKFLEETDHFEKIAWDLETDGFEFMLNNIGCFTCSFDGKSGYFIDWDKIVTHKEAFSKWLEKKFQIGANLKFDVKFMWFNGIPGARIDYDTFNAGHALDETRSQSLKTHSWIYTLQGGYESELDVMREQNPDISYLQFERPKLVKYATYDAMVTFQVYEAMEEEIRLWDIAYPMTDEWSKSLDKSWSLKRYLHEIVLPTVQMFAEIEYEGMHISEENLSKQEKVISLALLRSQANLDRIWGFGTGRMQAGNSIGAAYDPKFPWSSQEKLGQLLEEDLWPEVSRGKRKKTAPPKIQEIIRAKYSGTEAERKIKEWSPYKTKDEILEMWKKGFKEVGDESRIEKVEAIQSFRALQTRFSTFIGDKKQKSGYWQYIRKHPDNTLRVHSTFSPMLAGSGRNKSKDPNLQNVPARGEGAEQVRPIFSTPGDDFIFFSVDQAGLQLRLAGILSQDSRMAEIFSQAHGDMHSITAHDIFIKGNPLYPDMSLEEFISRKKEQPFATMRSIAKNLGFGLLFGGSPKVLLANAIAPYWSLEQAEEYLNQAFPNPDELKAYLSKVKKSDFQLSSRNSLSPKQQEYLKFLAVSTHLRTRFFQTYPGLEQWHKDYHALAIKYGFVRTPFGSFRRLPELQDAFQGHTKLRKDDEGFILSNKKNISLNSPIQGFEACLMHLGMLRIRETLKKKGMRSKFCGAIHDAVEGYAHREERESLKSIFAYHMTEDPCFVDELAGLKLEVEGNFADPQEGELWDMGKDEVFEIA